MTALDPRADAAPASAAEPAGPDWRGLVRHDRVVRGGLAIVAVHLAFRAWATFGSWWYGDDLAVLSRMLNHGLTPLDAARPYAGHLMPVPMYLTWLLHRISPFDWTLAATVLWLAQALAALGLLRLLVVLFGPRPGILPPLALACCGALAVPAAVSWTAGVGQLAVQLALTWGTAAFVTYLRTGRRASAVAALAWVAGSLLCTEKGLLVLALHALLALGWFGTGRVHHRIAQAWTRYRFAVVGGVLLAGAYVAWFALAGAGPDLGRTADNPVLDVAGNVALRAWLASLFGGPLRWAGGTGPLSAPDPSDLLVGAAAVVLLLLLRELRRARTRALRALLIPGAFLVADVLLLAAGRTPYVGAAVAPQFPSLGELLTVSAIALGAATMPILGAQEPVAVASESTVLDSPRAVAALTAVVCALGLVSGVGYARPWHQQHETRRYVEAVRTGLAGLPPGTPMADVAVPDAVLSPVVHPDNALSHLFRGTEGNAVFTPVGTDQVTIVDRRGRVRPLAVDGVRAAVPVLSPRTGQPKRCAYRVERDAVTVPLDGPLAYGGWWVRIGYLATSGSPVTVQAGGATYRTSVRPGVHALYFRAGSRTFDSVTLSGLQGDAQLCTADVTVGTPRPLEEDGP